MKIGRIKTSAHSAPIWALIDTEANAAQALRGPLQDWADIAARGDRAALPLADEIFALDAVQLLAPLDPQARIFGVGMNYLTHISKLGRTQTPPCTLGFIKPQSAIVGPDAEIPYPPTTQKFDFEIELVAVVARALGEVPHASACLLGYTIGNDISARDAGEVLSLLDLFGQKALDNSTPIGPWLVTLDEFGGAQQPAIDIELSVNGEQRQRDNTRNMIFPIDELLNFVDARVQLRPGDLIFTGTTCGVGKEDGRYLQPGDEIVARIENIGELRNRVGAKRKLSAARSLGRLGLPTE